MDYSVPVGLVGVGMVGGALLSTVRDHRIVHSYDPRQGYQHHYPSFSQTYVIEAMGGDPYRVLRRDCPLIFVAVPTPMRPDGRQDQTILRQVIQALDQPAETPCLVVIKSTVLPGTTEALRRSCHHLDLCFNPEFLREKTAADDFLNQDRIIVGATREASIAPILDLYRQTHPSVDVFSTDATTAELVKYAGNCFLAMKVSFANELYQIAQAAAVDYDMLAGLLATDARIGPSHLAVPGPDGKLGFGGACFPKDVNALLTYAREQQVPSLMLEATWKSNLLYRPEEDWKALVGRAVSGTP